MSAISEAKQYARMLVRKFNITAPPVNVETIVRGLGINLSYKVLDDELSGMAFISGRQKFIVVNKIHHPNRQRFTIAHECAHHVLHEDYLMQGVHVDKGILKRDPLSSAGKDYKEIAANAFAAELLMPRALISAAVPRDFDVLSDDDEVQRIADRFQVSPAALNIRLINLA
ncbi:MAG: ImmA/IrrE family metallo-endopeptidase [Sphingomonadaceae bacterium]